MPRSVSLNTNIITYQVCADVYVLTILVMMTQTRYSGELIKQDILSTFPLRNIA